MKALTRRSLLVAPLLAFCSFAVHSALADEKAFGSRTPTVDEFVEALAPAEAPRMRGIRPASTAAVATTAAAVAASAAASEPPKVSMQLQFAFDSAELSPESMASLDNLSAALKSERLSSFGFVIEGHTDAAGSDVYNQSLSERRAAAVRAYLIQQHNVSATRLNVVGRGEAQPLDALNPYSGINRRVAIANLGAM